MSIFFHKKEQDTQFPPLPLVVSFVGTFVLTFMVFHRVLFPNCFRMTAHNISLLSICFQADEISEQITEVLICIL